MRIKTVVGVAVAAGAAAVAAGIGGTALAAAAQPGDLVIPAFVESSPAVAPGAGAAGPGGERDCPEKNGSGAESPAPAESAEQAF